jgi:hypothetical protein
MHLAATFGACVLALVSSLQAPAHATCPAGQSSSQCSSIVGSCEISYWKGLMPLSKTQLVQYGACSPDPDGNTQSCCVDPCTKQSSMTACVTYTGVEGGCLWAPGLLTLAPGYMCITAEKLCYLIPADQCALAGMCELASDNVTCTTKENYSPDDQPAARISVADQCSGLPGLVVAMLVLMFLSLLGGIILVGVIVVTRKKAADEAEAREAADMAERDAAKRTGRAGALKKGSVNHDDF